MNVMAMSFQTLNDHEESYKVKYILRSEYRLFELQVKRPKNLGHLYPFEFAMQKTDQTIWLHTYIPP